ncbi:MAG: hypothetical protein H0Z33_11070 [Bacillaceae bacterium]|nr:hypothetical protein [Bacillaceae bacterium]
MSDEVYEHLKLKAENRELTAYIISLVESDLGLEESMDASKVGLDNMLSMIYKELQNLKAVIPEALFPKNEEYQEINTEEKNQQDVPELQQESNNRVSGYLDDDDVEYDF